ncbi:rap1 GTPase-GDP dissociation stimulator 1 isoform X1 [Brachionus plicatilis]|uniref:Rap1 GTPase-GDP dissociation stimulator 1 isoform X1 n=1 Tax=Brachionus plicatilis TaxID=10195 RepID=A0A3M7R3I4_BRAPC|nr:rap1 GTPase-GDP dissociation stimulator 1 isoform X1 [Brachionus plicatilis]
MSSESTDSTFYYTNILKSLKNLELESNESEETGTCSKIAEHKQQFCSDGLKLKQLKNELDNGSVESAIDLCEFIAELAKDELCRNQLVQAELLPSINKFLFNPNCSNKLKIQICRAIGNLCYENDDGRSVFLDVCGIDNLIDLLKYTGSIDLSQEEQPELVKLIVVSLGFLHNFANDNECVRKAVYEKNIMSILKPFAKNIKKDIGILMYFFSCIENLTEIDQGKIQFAEEKIAFDLYSQLDLQILDTLGCYTEDFFRILSSINEINDSKEQLCMTNFIEITVDFVEKRANDEDLLRIFGGFLTNLLANDDNIDMIYKYKDNFILEKAVDWLEKFQCEQLYLASAVIIANYMRNDSKAIEIVGHKNQPHVKIINLLRKYNDLGTSATLQQINVSHSLLSTLKNFCIAVSSKEELLKNEVIEVVVEFLNYENLEVLWKTLGIIRLLVKYCSDKNGLNIIFSDEILEKVEKIANNPQEHPGVTGESSRLCCYLPMAAKNEQNMDKYCKFSFINIVCKQLLSNHLIMINEAVLALNVLTTIAYRACSDKLKESSMNENVINLFEKESLAGEIKINLFQLFKILFEKSDFFTEQQLEQYLKIFNRLKIGQEKNEIVNAYLIQLINLLENKI